MNYIPIESLNLQMLNVGHISHRGVWNLRQVSSPFIRIYLVTEGKANMYLQDKTIELRPNHLYMVPAYVKHSFECWGLFEHYYLHLYEGFKNEANIFEMYDFPVEVEACDNDFRYIAAMCRQFPGAKLPNSNPLAYDNSTSITNYIKYYNDLPIWHKMRLRGAMLILFSRFLQQATFKVWTADERMIKVLGYIRDHLCDNIDIDTLADVACVTKSYFIRLFTREFGISPLHYINRKKIEKSQLLLVTSNRPVKDVAYALGFNDHSYFARLFKKVVNMSPMEFRKTMV
jgi:AraC-like DNA-binding protein